MLVARPAEVSQYFLFFIICKYMNLKRGLQNPLHHPRGGGGVPSMGPLYLQTGRAYLPERTRVHVPCSESDVTFVFKVQLLPGLQPGGQQGTKKTKQKQGPQLARGLPLRMPLTCCPALRFSLFFSLVFLSLFFSATLNSLPVFFFCLFGLFSVFLSFSGYVSSPPT